jgi:hypothetical protein
MHTWSLKQLCDDLEVSGCDGLQCQVVPIEAPDEWTGRSTGEIDAAVACWLQCAPTHERLQIVFGDSLDGRVFTATVWASLAGQRIEQLEIQSRVPLLRFRSGMSIATDLRAVHPARLAELEGVVLCSASCNRQA